MKTVEQELIEENGNINSAVDRADSYFTEYKTSDFASKIKDMLAYKKPAPETTITIQNDIIKASEHSGANIMSTELEDISKFYKIENEYRTTRFLSENIGAINVLKYAGNIIKELFPDSFNSISIDNEDDHLVVKIPTYCDAQEMIEKMDNFEERLFTDKILPYITSVIFCPVFL